MYNQYLKVVREKPHAVVFFILGDKYVTFDRDAELVSAKLSIPIASIRVYRTIMIDGSAFRRLLHDGLMVVLREAVSDEG